MRGIKTGLKAGVIAGAALWLSVAAPVMAQAPESFDAHKAAAEQGDAEAQYQLGMDYYYDEAHKDDVQALKWLEASAKQGYAKAAYEAAVMYSLGEGTPKDFARALVLYQQAAEGGIVRAYGDIGLAYRMGEGVEVDLKESVRWFRKGAEAGDPQSMRFFGDALMYGRGTEQDVVHGVAWIEKGANLNDAACEARMAELYYQGSGVQQSFDRAYMWAQRAAQHGSAGGYYYLGLMTENGEGTLQNYDKAFRYYQAAFRKTQHQLALIRIGVMMCNGWGTDKDIEGGLKAIESVATSGETEAFFTMGGLYEKGVCVAKDLPRAFVWKRIGIMMRDGKSDTYPDELKYLSDAFTPAERASLEDMTREVSEQVHLQYIDQGTAG